MPTVPKFSSLINACLRNRLAWILVFLHAAWFLLVLANMSPPAPDLAQFLQRGGWSSATVFAGRPFHFEYESVFLKLLFLIDLPSALVAIPLDFATGSLARMLHMSLNTRSYVAAAELLLVASFEWLLIGHAIHDSLASRGKGTWLIQKLNRHFIVVMSCIALFILIAAPIVNQRSRELGFRHGAISFH